jgi:DNA repair protein RadC
MADNFGAEPALASRAFYVPTFRISLVRDGSRKTEAPRIVHKPADAAKILRSCMPADADREVFAILLLDIRHKVIGFNVVSVGCLSYAVVHPREVMKVAVLANAAALVICHNHPSGDPSPSREDVVMTERLAEAGKLMGIDILDHVILGDGTDRWVSLKESGVIA